MASLTLIRCAIKIQLCVGHFSDGRMRTRTFGIGGVRPDLSADDIAAVVRSLAPLLAHPVVRVRFVRKYVLDGSSVQIRRGRRLQHPACDACERNPSTAMFLMPRITGRRGRRPLRLRDGELGDKVIGTNQRSVRAHDQMRTHRTGDP